MKIDYLAMDQQIADYINTLEKENRRVVALDIEGEYNLHQYGEKLCLIQVSDGDRHCVMDPFTVSDEVIAGFFGSAGFQKIMYDASSDQKLILKQYAVRVGSIIDLRPAAELLDLPKQDLASVVEQYLGVSKSKNYQKYDWTKRPVEPGALDYAMNDVLYLFDLKVRLFEELDKAGLTEEYRRRNEEINSRVIDLDRTPGFLRKPAFMKLRGNSKDKVRKVFYIRERYAEKYNVPPHWVFPNQLIIPLGTGRLSLKELSLLRGMDRQDTLALREEIADALKGR